MANTYTYTFLAKDLMSSKLSKISQKGQSTFNDINKKHENFNRNVDASKSKLAGMSNGLSSVVGLLGRIGVAFTVTGLATSIVNLGAEIEQTRVSFETMLGSAKKGDALIENLFDFANRSPYNVRTVQRNAETLLGFGLAHEKVLPAMRMLGDVSRGNKERFNNMTLAYAQMQSAGKLMGQDLLQMINAGFNPLQYISEATGKSMSVLRKEMEQGAISSDMVEQAFARATGEGGKFFNLMNKQSQTFSGKMQILIGKTQIWAMNFGQKLLPVLSRFVDWGIAVVDFLPQIPAYFQAVKQTIQDNIVPISLLTASLISLNAGLIWSKLSFLAFTVQFKAYVIWTKIATAAQWLWNAALKANPIGLIIAALFALAAGIAYAYQKVGWFRGGIQAIWETMKGFGNAIKEFVVDRIKQMIAGITGIGASLMAFFRGDWKKAWELGKEATKNLTGIGVGNGSKFMGNMKKTGVLAQTAYLQGISEANENKRKSSIFDKIKGAAGDNTSGGALSPAGALADPLKSGIDNITGGGNRQTNINVSFDKLVENFTVQTQTFEQGMDESFENFKRMLLRVMNSANQMQTAPV